MIEISIPLFGKPAWELPIEAEEITDHAMFFEKGDELRERLYEAGNIVKKLVDDGWSIYGTLYDLMASKSNIKTVKDAKRILKELKIDQNSVSVIEFEEDD